MTNQLLSDDFMNGAARAYVDGIDVPAYAEASMRRRRAPAPRLTMRRIASALAAAAVVAVVAFNTPALVAQVERVLRAFTIVGNRTVPVPVTDVSIAQARRDMPFEVIEPRAIPPGYASTIDEIGPSSDGQTQAQLLFRYMPGIGLPALTIVESKAETGPQHLLMAYAPAGATLPALPPLPPNGLHAFTARGGGRAVEVHPVSWVVRGTRVTLIAEPGALSPLQIAAIERAMSR